MPRLPLKLYLRAALPTALDRLVPSRRRASELAEWLETSRHLRNEAVERNADLAAERDAWKARWEQASADGLRAAFERDRLIAMHNELHALVRELHAAACPPTTNKP